MKIDVTIPSHMAELNPMELRSLRAALFGCLSKYERVTVREDIKDYMSRLWPKEYTDKDDAFFSQYAGEKVYAYEWCDDWWILGDDNYCLTKQCFKWNIRKGGKNGA